MGGRQISESEREAGMVALCLAEGNSAVAARELEAAGIKIHHSTLRDWKTRYPEEFERVRVQLAPKMAEKRAARLDAVTVAAVDVLAAQMEKSGQTIDDLAAKDLPGAARNTATVVGILTEKAHLLRGEPSAIVRHDYSDAIKALERMGLIEGTAEEIPDASSLPKGQPA